MRLLINGDSHAAGAEAVNGYAFAEDDARYAYLKRQPHPDNLKASWGKKLGNMLGISSIILAESASSNERILRTTNEWLNSHDDDVFMVIQWSTWERQEWLIDGQYFQVNASGVDDVPDSHRQKYKEFVTNVDWNQCEQTWHVRIKAFHEHLTERGIPHVFFNGNNKFERISEKHDWGLSYIQPYTGSYHDWLQQNGYQTVAADSYHYDSKAHGAWAKHLMRYIVDNKIF